MKLIVFGRVPQLGQVKTRLAAHYGPAQALAIYRELLELSLSQTQGPLGVVRELCLAGQDVDGECASLAQRFGLVLGSQCLGDLGQRMAGAFEQAFVLHGRVVLIGSDCPLLDASHIEWSFEQLERHDAVFVPTEDGGYSLIGLRRMLPSLFTHIEWSTDTVMALTRQRLRDAGASWSESGVLWDVDEPRDWQRWLNRLSARN